MTPPDDRFFAAVGLVSMLLYLLPTIVRMTAGQRRVAHYAAAALVALGVVAALAAFFLG
jgi:hypothetical protein